MGLTQPLLIILNTVAALAFVAALAVFARTPFAPKLPRGVIVVGCVGLVVYTWLYWILGDASFVFWDEEGEISPPIYRLLLALPDGARFAAALGGGNDAYAMFASGGQYVLPERFYLWLFPTWFAIALHKAVVFAVAFIGAYRLCRAATGCSRSIAAAVGLLHPFSYWILVNVTFTHGVAYAIFPLAVYVLVYRSGRPHYWLGALIMAAVLGSETRPSHTLGALLLALAGGAVLMGKTTWRDLARLSGAIVLVALFVALNWHEVLYAMWQVAPFTLRGSLALQPGDRPALGIGEFFRVLWLVAPVAWAVALAAMVPLVSRDARFAARAGLAVVVMGGLWLAVRILPWEKVGLGIVRGIGMEYHLAAFPTLALPVIAAGAQAFDRVLGKWPSLAARLSGAGIVAAVTIAVAA